MRVLPKMTNGAYFDGSEYKGFMHLYIKIGGIIVKSIGKKIFYTIVIMTIISLLFLGTFASTLSYNSTMEMAEMNLTETDCQHNALPGKFRRTQTLRASWA